MDSKLIRIKIGKYVGLILIQEGQTTNYGWYNKDDPWTSALPPEVAAAHKLWQQSEYAGLSFEEFLATIFE